MKKILLPGMMILAVFFECQPRKNVHPTVTTILPEQATITVSRENVRQSPNGKIIGTLKKGNQVQIKKRYANWLQFSSEKFDSAYVWAPSAGFPYVNLYSPFTYFDSSAVRFYPLSYLQALLGSNGVEHPVTSTHSEVFFSDIGLGSHEDIVIEVVDHQIEEVRHGITLYLKQATGNIEWIQVDFFRPVQGIQAALKKCELHDLPHTVNDARRITWDSGSMVKGITIALERREWESDWINAVRMTKTDE